LDHKKYFKKCCAGVARLSVLPGKYIMFIGTIQCKSLKRNYVVGFFCVSSFLIFYFKKMLIRAFISKIEIIICIENCINLFFKKLKN